MHPRNSSAGPDASETLARPLGETGPARVPGLAPETEGWDWLVWQLADSAFPTGGFAHSSGLEAAWQQGEVRGGGELRAFLEASLRQQFHLALPFVAAAHDERMELKSLDEWFDSLNTNHVANRASRAQGRSFLATTRRIFRLRQLQTPCGHLPPVFGAVCCELGIGVRPGCHLFLFTQLRGLASSAVRLNIVGPIEAQVLQHELAPFAQRLLARPIPEVVDAAQTAPLLELWQGAHDRLYSRLFQS